MTTIPAPNADELAQCVGCGLCLPHCPTYRVTSDERQSPRGRIALMRQWIDSGVVDDASLDALDSCVQCRGCEPACPSGVRYGNLIAETRVAMTSTSARPSLAIRAGLSVLRHPRLLRGGSTLIAIAQFFRLVPRRIGLPRVPLRRPTLNVRSASAGLPASGSYVWFFRGCVMDAWSRDVHVATLAVLRAAGVDVVQPTGEPGCCGALHHHAGLDRQARVMASSVMSMFPGESPVVVNSAGCGAMLKEYGHFLGTEEARQFASRVVDVHEYLANDDRLARLASAAAHPAASPVVVHDPCHLRHVQRVHGAVRSVLRTVAETVDLPDDGLCCGAGGSYFVTHPDMANDLLRRKEALINRAFESSGAHTVVSANPGCAMHLARGGIHIEHPMTFVAKHLGVTGASDVSTVR